MSDEKEQKTGASKGSAETPGYTLGTVDIDDLIEFANLYAVMGSAVQEQFIDLMSGDWDINANAVKVMKDKIGGFHKDIDREIKDFLEDV